MEHHYCSFPHHFGTGYYDYIDRSDEEVKNPLATAQRIDYSYLLPCTESETGNPGVTCHMEGGQTCEQSTNWCLEAINQCQLSNSTKTKISKEINILCQNYTFWRDIQCVDYFNADGLPTELPLRCRGSMQHCYSTWYYLSLTSHNSFSKTFCDDKSDHVYSAKECPNTETFLQIYLDQFCNIYPITVTDKCQNPRQWIQQMKDNANNQDPHGCWDSCADPGPNCQACTSKDYIMCEDSDMCIHKDLECDGHPQCLNGEDEDFYKCKNKWIKNKVFPSYATVKCRSSMYPSMSIIASPCDKIVECLDASDEYLCSNDIIAQIVLVATVCGIILFYICLKHYRQIGAKLNMTGCKNRNNVIQKKINKLEFSFEEFKDQPNDADSIRKVSNYLLYVIFSQKLEVMRKVLIEFYDLLDIIHNHREADVYKYLHNNLDPVIADEVNEAKFPGLKNRAIKKVEKTVQNKFITKFQDMIMESEALNRNFATLLTLIKLANHQTDFAKDLVILISLLIIVGGPAAIYNFPTNFSSVIVICLAVTIAVPLWMSSVQLVINDPYIIFNFIGKAAHKINKVIMILICMLSSSLNTMLLIFNYEEMKENARITAKEFDSDGNAAEIFKKCRILKIQLVEFLKLDLGMEVFYQVSLQIILLLFTQTKTPTTGGWESFFEQDSYLGLPLHPETILALSATWSLKTCIFLHIKTISVEKGFFPVTSRMAVFCWALFATLRKVLSNLAFSHQAWDCSPYFITGKQSRSISSLHTFWLKNSTRLQSKFHSWIKLIFIICLKQSSGHLWTDGVMKIHFIRHLHPTHFTLECHCKTHFLHSLPFSSYK